MNLRSFVFLSVLVFSARAVASDPAACSAAAKEIDDRIAAGNHPQQNVAIATQLRDGIMQSCAFMDANTLAQMLQGLDQLLPPADGSSNVPQKSAAERQAEREAQRAEADKRRAERDKRRAAERAREEAEQKLVSAVVRRPPTGRSTKGQFMARSDKMWGASVVDCDVYGERARLLYQTWPSREQGRDVDAARHYYVVEFDRNDNLVQHHIFETPMARTVTAGLLRGHDEIVVQWHEGGSDASASTLERWSISNAEMLVRSPAPRLQGPRGNLGADKHFVLVTAGGDLLFTSDVALETGPSPRTGLSWMLASPDGEVRDQGFIENDNHKVSASNWFHSTDGSAGLVVDVRGVGEKGIDSRLKPEVVRMGSADIRPVILSERRLYVTGEKEWGAKLPAFERQVMWLGLEKVPQSIMISGESTRLMDEAEGRHRFRDSAVSRAVAGNYRVAVAPSDYGHALLIKNNHRDKAFPPKHGLWLQEFAEGKPRRDTYLNPDSEHLNAMFEMLASDGEEKLYVAGKQHVMLLDGTRAVSAYAKSAATGGTVKAMVADGKSVWLFGENLGNGAAQQQVWVERIQF